MGFGYRLLGRTGLRVSDVCLGGLSLGREGGDPCEAVLGAFAAAGGNFVDLANRYGDGEAERQVGAAVAGDRERWVLATKYSLTMRRDDPNAGGNSRKCMIASLEGSLRRLGTDYIDLFWLHAWDFTTGVEEVMRALDDLVRAGKILHAGISDTPAWIISAGNTLSLLRGWTPFCAVQLRYSLLDRTAERDLIPMAEQFGLSATAWGTFGSGILADPASRELPDPDSGKIIATLGELAAELGTTPAQVAAAWVRCRQPRLIPVVGAGRVSSLNALLSSRKLALDPHHMERLDAVSAVAPGFPHDFLQRDSVGRAIHGDAFGRIAFAELRSAL